MLLDLRQRLEYGAFLLVAFLMRAVPLPVAAEMSARAWRFIAPKTRRHKRALKNLQKAMPEKTDAEREAIALDMWDNLGRVMAETFQLDRLLREPSRIELEDPVLLARYKNKVGPVVIVGMHIGNWEIGIFPALAVNAKPAAVYRLVENPYVDRYIQRTRALLYPAGLFAAKSDDGLATVMQIGNHVRSGGALGLLGDVVDWSGPRVPFFGQLVSASVAPAWIARRLGARLWIGYSVRIGKQSRFRISAKELKVPRTENAEEDIRTLTADIYKHFEMWIREFPGQWMWSNKRWLDQEMPGGSQY
jgi:KDO2-lipid IV(A) lauroyltransferase